MHQRFLAVIVLPVALLFSLSGSLLIATFCPHLQPAQVSCHTQVAESKMPGHDMGEMSKDSMHSMDSMHVTGEPASNPSPKAVALGQPDELCPHCAVHSRTSPDVVSLRETGAAKRPGGFANPVAVLPVAFVEMSVAAVLTSRAHGPPGTSTPRHILMNIFRI